MTSSRACRILHHASDLLDDGAAIRHGHYSTGPGPSQWGWYRESAGGDCRSLGDTAEEVLESARLPIDVSIAIDDARDR